MSAHVSVRTYILAAAVAWLFAGSHAIAQAPPAAADAEKRLRALEDKMDRVLKLMEARTAPLPAKESSVAAINAARDRVKAELQAKENERQQFQRLNPVGTGNEISRSKTILAERIAKIDSRRSELRIKLLEMVDQLARIEKAYKDGGKDKGNKAALFVIRALAANPKILDEHPAEDITERLELQRKKVVAAHGERDPGVADVDSAIALVRKIYAGRDGPDARDYITLLKEEIADLSTRTATLDNMIDAETKKAREMIVFQAEDDRFRNEIDGLRNTLKVLDSLLTADESQKPK
jgi:hypothetical protein